MERAPTHPYAYRRFETSPERRQPPQGRPMRLRIDDAEALRGRTPVPQCWAEAGVHMHREETARRKLVEEAFKLALSRRPH